MNRKSQRGGKEGRKEVEYGFFPPFSFFSTQTSSTSLSEIEEELGLTMGVTDELEAERMREMAEKDLVGKNLLGEFGPLLVKVCSDAQYDVSGKQQHKRKQSDSVFLLLLVVVRIRC